MLIGSWYDCSSVSDIVLSCEKNVTQQELLVVSFLGMLGAIQIQNISDVIFFYLMFRMYKFNQGNIEKSYL